MTSPARTVESVAESPSAHSALPADSTLPLDASLDTRPARPRILVPLDGSDLAEQILPQIVGLARGIGAEVQLLRAMPIDGGRVGAAWDATVRAGAESDAYLLRAGERLCIAGVAVAADTVFGEPAPSIARFAVDRGVDLIAMSTHGRTGLSRLVVGSVAAEVLERAQVPVLLYHPSADGSAPSATVRRILVPLDGSELAESALPVVVKLALTVQAEVVVTRIVRRLVLPAPAGLVGSGSTTVTDDQATSAAATYLNGVLHRLRLQGIAATRVVADGDPARSIRCTAARMKCDLIVLATHGQTGVRRWLLGSVAESVVRTAGRPVILIGNGVRSQPTIPDESTGDTSSPVPAAG